MSTERDFDEERERREWQAQENALRAERAGARGRRLGRRAISAGRARVAQPAACADTERLCRAGCRERRAQCARRERERRDVARARAHGLVAAGRRYGLDRLQRRLVARALVQRAGARCIRRPDDRELESRDRGLRRHLLGVRAGPQAVASQPALDGSHRAHLHGHGARGRGTASRDAAGGHGALHGRQCARRRRLCELRTGVRAARVSPRLDARRPGARSLAVRADGHPACVGPFRALAAQTRRRACACGAVARADGARRHFAPDARLAQQLRLALAHAVRRPMVLRRCAVRHRSVVLAASSAAPRSSRSRRAGSRACDGACSSRWQPR